MSINLKDIKENFILNYVKYWIFLFIVVFIFLTKKVYNHFFVVQEFDLGIKNAKYVAVGVAINNKFVITNKQLIESQCIGKHSNVIGDFYFIQNYQIIPASIYMSDPINNLILMRVKKYDYNLKYFSYLQEDKTNYKKNTNYYIPIITKKINVFDFKKGQFVSAIGYNLYFYIHNFFFKDKFIIGDPIFDKNFLLQGILKERNENYYYKNNIDKFLKFIGYKKTYLVNDSNIIKNMLNKYNINYNTSTLYLNLNDNFYNVKKSVVQIICIQPY